MDARPPKFWATNAFSVESYPGLLPVKTTLRTFVNYNMRLGKKL